MEGESKCLRSISKRFLHVVVSDTTLVSAKCSITDLYSRISSTPVLVAQNITSLSLSVSLAFVGSLSFPTTPSIPKSLIKHISSVITFMDLIEIFVLRISSVELIILIEVPCGFPQSFQLFGVH